MYAGSDGAMARMAAIAVPGLRQPWFASTLIAISGTNRLAHRRDPAGIEQRIGGVADFDFHRAEPVRDVPLCRRRHRRLARPC